MVENLPDNWFGGFLDAAFFNSKTKEIYLLKGEEYVRFSSKKSKGVVKLHPQPIRGLGSKYPFNWSAGNIDAALYNANDDKIYLYRGPEYLTIDFKNAKSPNSSSNPKKTQLEFH